MEILKEKFIRQYTRAIREGNAAIFAGAGLSRASGYVDWKNLLKPFAEELGLDVDKEHDLLSIAQYYRNEAGSRAGINQELLNAFSQTSLTNENVEIIARLPIETYWTTNYDRLIEDELKKIGRKVDVKIDSDQLANRIYNRDAIVYKMHGDKDNPSNAVITKDDYILYDKKRPFFKTILKGDLISKKFLFIGFSFEDPNLEYILGQIHALMDENVTEHYCFFRRVQRSDYRSDEEYGYEKAKQELRTKDMNRYGIKTVYVDSYSEITDILRSIEREVKRNNVFISGSADDYADWGKKKAEKLAIKISENLIMKDFMITSGFGLGLGSAVVNGALTEIYRSKYSQIEKYLCLRPFPYGIVDADERKNQFSKYRNDMIAKTGVAIFIFGNKKDPTDSDNIIDSQGCFEEFEIAKNNKNIIIPIGSTGFMAKKIWNEVKANIGDYKYLEKYIDELGSEKDIDNIVDIIINIVSEQCRI
jgi:hypothetical protein